ncbi:hypothetical protein [Tenggerimyces flavus]|uniref:DUF6199 domain-containing protein n=1 Tax=Tenggerimyces flavus TaxID=1708749 RepID=A0ABV7YPA3_9ACTN|nr:hypothetical protein [Tenggerimyces flavus]MBM7786341.1 hypothetical protein [Tenggerimyces flavus]
MHDLLWLLLPLSAVPIWGIISPRSQWRVLHAWLYRNPEANEPSDAAYTAQRVGNAFVLVMIVVVAVIAADQFPSS